MERIFLMFLDHTRRRTTVGRTPLDERSARRRDLKLITHDTHNRQISMPPVGFEPTISAGVRPQAAHLGKEQLGHDANPSPPSNAVVMKGQTYTSTPPMGHTACTQPQCLYKVALYLYLNTRNKSYYQLHTDLVDKPGGVGGCHN